MFGFLGQCKEPRIKLIFGLSCLFLLVGFGDIIQYLIIWIKYLNCVGPINWAVFVGNGLQIVAGILGFKIAVNGASLGRYTTYFLLPTGIMGVLMAAADLLSRYQLGHPLGFGAISIGGGMMAIGIIGFFGARASRNQPSHVS
jgi:hypothetical protein